MLSSSQASLSSLVGEDRFSEVVSLLDRNGISKLTNTSQLAGGKNNRVIKLTPESGVPIILKVYFRSPSDLRDRLRNEFSFSKFAWNQGLRALPEPIDADYSIQCGLYEYIESYEMARPVSAGMVEQAWSFVCAANQNRNTEEANVLHLGSEACFTLSQHLAVVESRLARLGAATAATEIGYWIGSELLPHWQAVQAAALASAQSAGIGVHESLDRSEWIISPSDFGFHNAMLRKSDNTLCFHDFEYAGWDDPAKLFGDFFNQIEVPVSLDYLHSTADTLVQLSTEPQKLGWRLNTLLPVYAVKWCCIALNPVLASDASRRQFSGQDAREAVQLGFERSKWQLGKARDIFKLGDYFYYG
jgi:Phosphotransferase enzyme family